LQPKTGPGTYRVDKRAFIVFFHRIQTPADVLDVVETSGLLAVSEFHVFEMAYANWYGVESDESVIEEHFIPYMFREEVPPYVRAFTRKIRSLDEAGELDPAGLGIERDERTVRGVVSGLLYSLFVVASVSVLVALAKVTAERLGLAECMFPPCF
jgi:hypothetical protein